MTTDKIVPVRKEHLLLMQVLCWAGPGIKIFITGLQNMAVVQEEHPERCWWLWLIAVTVVIAFTWMFRNFVQRYTNRILTFSTAKKSLFAFFDLRGYLLIFFMMGLGISLKFIPGMPAEFFAGFYPGLGTALIIAGARFLRSWLKAVRQS